MTEREAYDALCAYTLAQGDPTFIHQHVVDSFAAQAANDATKSITLTFALIGLYLHVERQFTGREVQRAHQQIARRKRPWPSFILPTERGSVTAVDVLAHTEGAERNNAIHAWATAVWEAFYQSKPDVEALLSHYPEVIAAGNSGQKPKSGVQ